jgi:hypothetical protein
LRGRADERFRLVWARVEHGDRRHSEQRQFVEPPVHADPDPPTAALMPERSFSRQAARQAVHVRRRAGDEQIELVERRQIVVDGDELHRALDRKCVRNGAGDPLGVSERRLVDDERSHARTSVCLRSHRRRRRGIRPSVCARIRLLEFRT